MSQTATIALVDGNFQRLAAILHCLVGKNVQVEPFTNVSTLISRWSCFSLLLVHDDGRTIARLLSHMENAGQWLPIVGFAQEPTTRQVVQAMLDGALDYIAWPFSGEEIVQIMTEAQAKAQSQGSEKLRREMAARSRIKHLTKREREVLVRIVRGFSNRMIGEALAISPRTVEVHRTNMLAKMKANHTSEAIRIAIDASLTD